MTTEKKDRKVKSLAQKEKRQFVKQLVVTAETVAGKSDMKTVPDHQETERLHWWISLKLRKTWDINLEINLPCNK